LRVMLTSILCSLKSLVWVLVLVLFGLLIFAILFTSSAIDHGVFAARSGTPPSVEGALIQASFGTVPKSLLTEYMAITGGITWGETIKVLEKVHPIWVVIFLIYHFFFFFAILNMVTGVFCHDAMQSASKDTVNVIEAHIESVEQYADNLKRIFQDMDMDGSGFVTIQEMEEHLRIPIVQAYFSSLEIDPTDTWTLFSLLDADGTHEIDLEEFIIGCLRLKGHARSVDLVRLGYENKWVAKKLKSIDKSIVHCQKVIAKLRSDLRRANDPLACKTCEKFSLSL